MRATADEMIGNSRELLVKCFNKAGGEEVVTHMRVNNVEFNQAHRLLEYPEYLIPGEDAIAIDKFDLAKKKVEINLYFHCDKIIQALSLIKKYREFTHSDDSRNLQGDLNKDPLRKVVITTDPGSGKTGTEAERDRRWTFFESGKYKDMNKFKKNTIMLRRVLNGAELGPCSGFLPGR